MDSEPYTEIAKIGTKAEPQITHPEGLAALDKIKPVSNEILPESVCVDTLVASANVANEQIGEIIKYEVAHPTEDITDIPKSFAEMLDASRGNFVQRAVKAWIKPRNPEGTIKLMKALQVDHFQKMVIKAITPIRRLSHIEKGTQTNYALGDNSLESLTDFATNQTTFNEVIHLSALSFASLAVLGGVAGGRIDSLLAVNTGVLIVNTYCVLAQRYSRARLSIAIEKVLRRNKHFNLGNYTNLLGIQLPKNKQENE
ncbi:hypothetical protein HY502_02540 [Candidatus Woesebacteria bacterium]|nr:hypothetical protein [Candidatus Woesebacteria bacterium]